MVNIDITEPGQDEPMPEIDSIKTGPRAPITMKPENLTRRELAILILQWEDQQTKADKTAGIIQEAVLSMGETFAVGSVQAKYSKGRATLDWESPVVSAHETGQVSDDTWHKYSKEIPEEVIESFWQIDYKGIAQELDIEPKIIKAPTPSVKMQMK